MEHLIKELLNTESVMKEDIKEELWIMKKRLKNADQKSAFEIKKKIELRNRLLDIIEADAHFYRNLKTK